MPFDMEDLTIHYLISNNRQTFLKQFQQVYAGESIRWEEFEVKEPVWENIRILFILEPVRIEGKEYAISCLWKSWLSEYAPHVTLIVAAFAANHHPNFLNLADLPTKLHDTLCKQSFPISEFRPEPAGTDDKYGVKRDVYVDPWLRHLPLTGRDMVAVMTDFIRGHDKANSFFDQLVNLRKDLHDLAYWSGKTEPDKAKITEIGDRLYEEWLGLRNRWSRYYPFMHILPFAVAANRIEELIGIANEQTKEFENPLLEDNQKVLLKLNDEIFKEIFQLLERYFLPYIYRTDSTQYA